MNSKGLGRDGTKVTICMYKGRETDCPKQCESCAIPVKLLADAAIRNGDADMALALYRKATDMQPDYVEAWNNIGNLLGVLMRFSEALDAFETAVSIDPTYGKALKGLATTLMNLTRYGEAQDVFNKLFDLYDDSSLSREYDEFKRRTEHSRLYDRETTQTVLEYLIDYASSSEYTPHSSVVYTRRLWDRAFQTATLIFTDALKSAPDELVGRDVHVYALKKCFLSGIKAAELNETMTARDLEKADYENRGFYSLIDLENLNNEEQMSEIAHDIARKAIIHFRDVSGIAEYERESGTRAKASAYIDCAIAVFLTGTCFFLHKTNRW